jgi:negative regulator of flagellin synthesis FlgM
MSNVSPLHRPAAPTLDPQVRPSKPQASVDTARRGEDQVELSDKAQLLSKIADLPDIRQDMIDRVKASIADGSYETEDKTDAAIDNLLEDIA